MTKKYDAAQTVVEYGKSTSHLLEEVPTGSNGVEKVAMYSKQGGIYEAIMFSNIVELLPRRYFAGLFFWFMARKA